MTFRTRAAALAVAALIVAGCGGGDDTAGGDLDLVAPGTLTVCSDIPYEPFEYEDPDAEIGYSGFDIELIQAVADELDLEVQVIGSGFEGLTSGATMAAGTCDLAISAMTITPEREEQIDFSEPYYDAVQSLLIPEGSEITGLDDLTEGVTVGVQSGTTGEAYAEENVPGADVLSFENTGDLFVALEAGQVDAVLQDQPVNVAYARENPSEVIEEYQTDESYGIALEKDRGDELLASIDEALETIRDDGTYDEIYDEYFAVE